MRPVLFLLVLACVLRAESIPITGSFESIFPGHDNLNINGPALSFNIGDPDSCLYCGDPDLGACPPGTVCGFNSSWSDELSNPGFFQFYGVTYNGTEVDFSVPSSVSADLNYSTTGEPFNLQDPLIEPVTVSGELEASIGNQQFLDLFVSGSGTAQIFVDGPISSVNGLYHVSGIEVDFTGTASTSAVPEPKSEAFVILSMAGTLAFLRTRRRILH
jgi:hypothetical protein